MACICFERDQAINTLGVNMNKLCSLHVKKRIEEKKIVIAVKFSVQILYVKKKLNTNNTLYDPEKRGEGSMKTHGDKTER